jgi:ribonucleoside-triphosphate reductase (formate)
MNSPIITKNLKVSCKSANPVQNYILSGIHPDHVNVVDLVDNYISDNDWQVKENGNMGYSLQGMHNYLTSELTKVYWLNKIYPESIKSAHESGDFHIHDLGTLASYCVGWDLMDLITNGFGGVSNKVECRAPRHLRSTLGQIVNFFYTLTGEVAGAIAFSNLDTLLAPFIRYDGLNFKDTKQAVQEFVYNLNVPTRVGFQTPFTNITLDLMVSPLFKDQPVVIGGQPQKETYSDFQEEMDIFNKAFFEVMSEGDAMGRVFTFPIPTINITKDFDWESKSLNSLWEITGKYGVPYFSNFVNSDMNPEDARSMCCRLRLDNRELKKRGGGLFGSNPLTGSIGVVTLNMPRLGLLSRSKEDFLSRLDMLMDTAKESMEIKRSHINTLTDMGMYPYSTYFLRDIKNRFGNYWQNHFSTIGIVGMNEACLNLLKEDIGSKASQDFTLQVMDFMNSKLVEYQEETGHMYNLEATPAESTAYRLANKDKVMFGDEIISANEEGYQKGAEVYYTNSTQLPIDYTDDIFEALDLEDKIQSRYTGGTVKHLYLGERITNYNSIKNLIKKICHNYTLPYFSITPTFSISPKHGYISGEHEFCPKHDAELLQKGEELTEENRIRCEIYSRVVGYIRPITNWNKSKRQEFKDRKVFRTV